MNTLNSTLAVLLQAIVAPVVGLFMGIALLYFLWGVVMYIWKGSSTEGRANGQKHMFWGIIGLAIMISVFGIMHFIFGTVVSIGGQSGITGQVNKEPTIDKGFNAFNTTQSQ